MPTPRENTSIVKAPVLFRLPHLHSAVAGKATAASPAVAANTARGTALADPSLETAESAMPPKPTAAPANPESHATVNEETFMSRWGFEIKRSVILLAAMALLWGAWTMGQKSATAPHESNLAEIIEAEPVSDPESVAVINPTSEPPVEVAAEPRVAQIIEPKLSSSSGSSRDFVPVTEPQPSFYGSDDLATEETPAPPSESGVVSDFSTPSLDAIEPPSNGEFYGDYDLGEPAQASAQKPPLTIEAGDSSQIALNEPTLSPASETASPTATNFVPSTTPEVPGFDPSNIGNVGNAAPQNLPVLSSTPNGVIDWSRYLPGASGSGPIRAVSATQTMGGAAGESQSADAQAIYLDKNAPNSADVGVAPYYR